MEKPEYRIHDAVLTLQPSGNYVLHGRSAPEDPRFAPDTSIRTSAVLMVETRNSRYVLCPRP